MKEITKESLIEYGFVQYKCGYNLFYNVVNNDGIVLKLEYGVCAYYGNGGEDRLFFSVSEFNDYILDYEHIEQIDALVKALTVKNK